MTQPYCSYEVSPVSVRDNESPAFAEAHTTLDDARRNVNEYGGSVIWSLYGRLPEGGVECIGDFKSELAALETYAKITGLAVPECVQGTQILVATLSNVEAVRDLVATAENMLLHYGGSMSPSDRMGRQATISAAKSMLL